MNRFFKPIFALILLGFAVWYIKRPPSAPPDDADNQSDPADYPDMLPMRTKFPDFHVMSVAGKPLSIAADKGKVILLDFWATWCGPCCEELPNVVSVYNKYHQDGFDVIGISLDGPGYKDTLASFCPANGITWPQFCDGQVWDNALAVQYKIHAIPCTYLLDGSGTIIGENLRGSSLAGAVARALAQSAKTAANPAPPVALNTSFIELPPDPPAKPPAAPAKTAAATAVAATPSAPRRLKPHLTHDDIINALGTPDSDAKLGPREQMNYKNGPHIELTNGTVTTFNGPIPDALKQPDVSP